ncbi:Dihydropteroate synthase domain-containing protein [Rozella allomycis CSF55]|uniref:Folic acid synthesis protein FOL1 n=1 Tax=Rozella allomycis (strain CSF55) TaxID=988480 RepID=A0A075ASQ9_ROZAC|nr:Dihydropteroate synthase domain-containing protein [Rozella allomycis CSF55]|eukprot:EPZ33321.1 Dihydropteroate synthase domain-containing protein [Rozella allomycis CSF55]
MVSSDSNTPVEGIKILKDYDSSLPNSKTFKLLRYPLLLITLTALVIDLIAYTILRQIVRAYEYFNGHVRNRNLRRWQQGMKTAKDLNEYTHCAKGADKATHKDKWRKDPRSPYFDYNLIKEITDNLRGTRLSNQNFKEKAQRMIKLLLESGVRCNLGGIMHERLYNQSYIGTKTIIEQFTGEGVIKTMLDQGILPRIISGTSSGAIMAAIVCTRTDEQLLELYNDKEQHLKLMSPLDSMSSRLLRFLRSGAMVDTDYAVSVLRKCTLGDLTFIEAYKKTGRILNISVIHEDHQKPPQILNYLTTPDVVIHSAVLASIAIPFMFRSVKLYKKIPNDELKPCEIGYEHPLKNERIRKFSESSPNFVTHFDSIGVHKWRDGTFKIDVPTEKLSQLFNTQFTIVSQVNPMIIPFFYERHGSHSSGFNFKGGFIASFLELYLKLDMRRWLQLLRQLYLLPTWLKLDWSYFFLQTFHGSVTMFPKPRFLDYLRLMNNPSKEYFEYRVDNWDRFSSQPVIFNLKLKIDISSTSETDSLEDSVSYSTVAKTLKNFCLDKKFKDLVNFADEVSLVLFSFNIDWFKCKVSLPKCLLNSNNLAFCFSRNRVDSLTNVHYISINELALRAIIGLNSFERIQLQPIKLDIKIFGDSNLNYKQMVERCVNEVESTKFKTVERLCCFVMDICKEYSKHVSVKLLKPAAVLEADGAGVLIKSNFTDDSLSKDDKRNTCFVALGSNLGDSYSNINAALCLMECSKLSIETDFHPLELLHFLQGIEQELKRVKEIDNGPRTIDLDILFYNDLELITPELTIPHPRIPEREFVLAPFCDILQNSQNYDPEDAANCVIMGVLNVTPDSFSDGGDYFSVEAAVEHALEMVEQGADIIDIGGCSTRPFADEPAIEEELRRVIPVIEAIRRVNNEIPISIDTFRSEVAAAAIKAGADMINDVSGGLRDQNMYKTMALANVPVCLMHMRGNSKTMNSLNSYEDGLINTLEKELSTIVSNALKSGIRPWNIILDPGIGFSKNTEQNLEILQNLKQLKSSRLLGKYPWLIGVSRKRFIGELTQNDDAKSRDFGTLAVSCHAVMQGANVIRIHNVKDLSSSLKLINKLNK